MKPADRYAWIVAYMKARSTEHAPCAVDVLNGEFVDSYVDATGANFLLCFYGASTCPQLGRDLSAMHKAGLLTRWACGIGDGLCHQGFPRWVYSYKLAQA